MNDPEPYVVRQGDHLRQLAHHFGFDAEQVWSHPLNEHLRNKRGAGDDLLPGDILWLTRGATPALEVIPTVHNAYTAHIPRIRIDLFFEDTDGAIANEPCVVRGLPGSFDDGVAKTSDDRGGLVLQVPVTVAEITVTFPGRHRTFGLQIGHMDPLVEQSGLVKRLGNLGYLDLDYAAHRDDVAGAIAQFQRNAGLTVTGQPDEATLDRLFDEAAIPPSTVSAR